MCFTAQRMKAPESRHLRERASLSYLMAVGMMPNSSFFDDCPWISPAGLSRAQHSIRTCKKAPGYSRSLFNFFRDRFAEYAARLPRRWLC